VYSVFASRSMGTLRPRPRPCPRPPPPLPPPPPLLVLVDDVAAVSDGIPDSSADGCANRV
jgi:hypothetical protein